MVKKTRRNLLALGGLAALGVGWQVFGVVRPGLDIVPIPGLPGWQFGSVGQISGVSGRDLMTIGLERAPDPLPQSALWDTVHRDPAQGHVPIAVFSDFFCPYCRVLIDRLAARTSGPPLAITWHELPLLSPASHIVARAAEAAARQNGYAQFYATLLRAEFRPTKSHMHQVADQAGLNGGQLVTDMDSAYVADRLSASARAARTLGIAGTPGIVIGRTSILGALGPDMLEQLIAETPLHA